MNARIYLRLNRLLEQDKSLCVIAVFFNTQFAENKQTLLRRIPHKHYSCIQLCILAFSLRLSSLTIKYSNKQCLVSDEDTSTREEKAGKYCKD